ncbi:MAG TPA: cytochrome P450 [Beutenbergiaceae bacterium]|nr:cytochrome P450 [Beutenbergiaceae bacterium]
MSATGVAPVPFPTERTLFDPPPELGEYRRTEPIRPLQYPDGEVGWLVTSHALARQVLGDRRLSMKGSPRFIARPGEQRPDREDLREQMDEVMTPSRAGTFINMDAPEHIRFRRALAGRFSVKYVAGLAEVIEEIVAGRLDAMANAPQPVDLQAEFAVPVALETICYVMGISIQPEWNSILEVMEVDPPLQEDLLGDYRAFRDAMAAEVQKLREHPNEGLLSFLLQESQLTEEEVIGVGQFLVVAGHHTTSSMLGLSVLVLQQNREDWEAVVADPEGFPDMLEELVRYINVLQLAPFTRTAIEDLEVGGVQIKAGQRVQVSAAAANRDPDFLTRPDEFDPKRDVTGHLAFGHGVHQCLGQHLARLELRIALTRLVERFGDLRPAVPVAELEVNPGNYPGHGVPELPVVWDTAEGDSP